jgi:3D (Asp-Asp-Asp) domain-containing protein
MIYNYMTKISQKIEQLGKSLEQLAGHLSLKKWEIALLAVFTLEFAFPHVTLAEILGATAAAVTPETIMFDTRLVNASPDAAPDYNSLPTADAKKPKRTMWVTVTAYSSAIDQCDADPCVTASGLNVCRHNQEDVVAANFLPFGAVVKMPEIFGNRIFTVQDRMNARYTERIDVWFRSREAAREFGVQRVLVEIY